MLNPLTIWIPTLLLLAARIAGLLMTAPVLSHPVVPKRLRIFLSLVMALAAVGRLAGPVPAVGGAELVFALATELAIGATIGFALSLMLAGVEVAAVQISQQLGFGLAEVYNATAGEGAGIVR